MRNYKQFFAICKNQGFEKEETVLMFTNKRTASLRELTDREFESLMEWLEEINKAFANQPKQYKEGDEMRKKMIAIAFKMKWGKNIDAVLKALDEWCQKQKFKKGLMGHDKAELAILVSVFEDKVWMDHLKKLND